MFNFCYIKQGFWKIFRKIFEKSNLNSETILKNNSSVNVLLTFFPYNNTNNNWFYGENMFNFTDIKQGFWEIFRKIFEKINKFVNKTPDMFIRKFNYITEKFINNNSGKILNNNFNLKINSSYNEIFSNKKNNFIIKFLKFFKNKYFENNENKFTFYNQKFYKIQFLEYFCNYVFLYLFKINFMRLIFLGDVCGKPGVNVVLKYSKKLINILSLDFLIINGENSHSGLGISEKICNEFWSANVDAITLGNHAWDCRNIISYIEIEKRLIRPINYFNAPGNGYLLLQKNNINFLVINLMGQVFMRPHLDNPFISVDKILKRFQLCKNNLNGIFVDFHAEATAEKVAMGFHLDGRVSAVVGTHTHIPTADYSILPKGTAYQSDAGMCGDYLSIIGAPVESLEARYITNVPTIIKNKTTENEKKEATICGTYIEIDDKTGLSKKIEPIIIGPNLKNKIPYGLTL